MNNSLAHFITTKDAAKLSGYTADYLARLVRSGNIKGERIGHSWLLEEESLRSFLKNKEFEKNERARVLANERAKEYREHTQTKRETPFKKIVIDLPQRKVPAEVRTQAELVVVSLRSHALAFSLAVSVVVMGGLLAQSATMARTVSLLSNLAVETASGFRSAYGDIPSRVALYMERADLEMQKDIAYHARFVGQEAYTIPAGIVAAGLVVPEVGREAYRAPTLAYTLEQPSGDIIKDTQAFGAGLYDLASNPDHLKRALIDTYVYTGVLAYEAIWAMFSAYETLVYSAAAKTLALGAATRDALSTMPQAINRMNLALGELVIAATHAAIRADVAVVYRLAEAAPVSARIVFVSAGTLGNTLAEAAMKIPPLAIRTYLHLAALPSILGPELAQAVVTAEYRIAVHFVSATSALSERYLAVIEGTGRGIYQVVSGAPEILTRNISALASVGVSIDSTKEFILAPGW